MINSKLNLLNNDKFTTLLKLGLILLSQVNNMGIKTILIIAQRNKNLILIR